MGRDRLSDGIDRDEAAPLALGVAQWQKAPAQALQAGGDDNNKPAGTRLVFKDSAFADDVARTNLTAILSQHGLDDVRSILMAAGVRRPPPRLITLEVLNRRPGLRPTARCPLCWPPCVT